MNNKKIIELDEKEIDERSIQREMIYQMDMNSESEILKKATKIK